MSRLKSAQDLYRPVVHDQSWKRLRKGSIDYNIFWNREIDRCINGYTPTGGTYITGVHYFYLNYCKIDLFNVKTGRKEINHPMFRDQDQEYFYEVDKARREGYGLVVLKARRKGFSFMNTVLLVHEWTFFKNSISGIGAQTEAYVSDFRRKLLNTYYDLPSELRLSTLRNHSDLLFSGYKEKINGIHVEKGMKSQILFRVMEKPDMFRGTSLNWMIFEEAGEFKKLKEAFYANEECFREGSHQFGVPIVGGTSNNITNDANDFIHMYHNPEEYGCKSIFIPASKVYHGFFNYETGLSDVEGATKDIEKRAAEKKKSSDKKLYYAFRQEMPLKPEHAFLSVGDTPFDIEKINNQVEFLNINPKHDISFKANLEWPLDKFGKPKFGGMPELVPSEDGVYNIVHRNLPKFKNVHVAGVDPYHVDDEFEERGEKNFRESKGCMYVYRRFVDMNEPGDMPVAEYCDRPYSKELFYEGCLKLCIYYDSQILVENNDSGFLKYFQDKGFMRYIMRRPKSLDAPYSQATNAYGITMKTYQKRMLAELVDNYIRSQCGDIYFRALLNEFTKYGKKNTDRVMAFGISLIANESITNTVKLSNEKPPDLSLPEFDPNGYMVRGNSVNSTDDKPLGGIWDI